MKVNVLGVIYTIKHQDRKDNPKLEECNGLCEIHSKQICILNIPKHRMNVDNIEDLQKKILRHEVIHAFFQESGLGENSEFGRNEELVDWIAIQFPKLYEAFRKIDAL